MIAAQNALVILSLISLVLIGFAWGYVPEEDDDLADDEVYDEDGLIHRPGQMPRRGWM